MQDDITHTQEFNMAIENLINPTPTADTYYSRAVADGYVYECSCGELYNSVHAAYTCRKCRNYCVFGHCTHVVDVRTGEVVAGKEPTEAEWAEAKAEAEARWAEDHAALDRWIENVKEEAEVRRAAEEEEEMYWGVQDEMSGIK